MSDEISRDKQNNYSVADLDRRLARIEAYRQMSGNDEVDLGRMFMTIWVGRRYLFVSVGIFVLLGLFMALGSSEEFTAEVKLMPESRQANSMGGLGGLARQFGVNSGQQTTEGIPAELYPDIAQSLVLMNRLMDHEVQLPEQNSQVTLFDYFREHRKPSAVATVQKYTIRLPFTVLGAVKGWLSGDDDSQTTDPDRLLMDEAKMNRILRMNSEEWEVVRTMRNRISANMAQETGIVAVSVKMPDPNLAADVADQIVEYLMEYITSYRTGKARNDVEFIEERYAEARSRFETAQEQMARFNDENRGQLTAMARTQEQRLQSEYNLTFNLYNSMAERLEEARIKLQDETPVVNILEPAAVPDQRSEPNRGLIIIMFIMLGGVLGIGFVFAKNRWDNLKMNIEENMEQSN